MFSILFFIQAYMISLPSVCASVFDVLCMPRWSNPILFFNSVYFQQAVHVAAQYGQTTFLNHIIAKYNADFDAPDNDGRSPLHWYD